MSSALTKDKGVEYLKNEGEGVVQLIELRRLGRYIRPRRNCAKKGVNGFPNREVLGTWT